MVESILVKPPNDGKNKVKEFIIILQVMFILDHGLMVNSMVKVFIFSKEEISMMG